LLSKVLDVTPFRLIILKTPEKNHTTTMTDIIKPSRRTFLKGLGAASVTVPAFTWGRVGDANGDVRVAICGTNGKGNAHLGDFAKVKGCRIVAICDPDKNLLTQRQAEQEKKGIKVETYVDYRKMLENKDIDAVVIATPNHLHTLIAIESAKAGKHVYVEKPVSHNVWEGRKLVEASEKFDVIIQHGMQRRSDSGWHEIIDWIKDEPLGKMTCSRGLCYKPRNTIGLIGDPIDAPAHVDYNLWCGPRSVGKVNRKRFHYDWHWQFDYGNGDIGNQGPHQIDAARWVLGDPPMGPTTVLSIGGRFGYEDDANTANTQIAFYDFKPVPLIFEVRGLPRKDMNWRGGASIFKGVGVGNIIEFEGGYVAEGRAYDNDGKTVKKFSLDGGGGHQQRFINHVKEGNIAATHTATQGHLSASLAHMANTSYRLGKEQSHAEISEKLSSDKLALETFDRFVEHLAVNKLDVEKIKPVLGPSLTFDPKAEVYTGSLAEEANKVATDFYRDEFKITV
jgi:predicted dehydrogenase